MVEPNKLSVRAAGVTPKGRQASVSPRGRQASTSPRRGGAAAAGTGPRGAKQFPYEFKTKAERTRALARVPDMSRKDPLLHHMIQNIETIASPKMVCFPGDWLKTESESGQTIAQYQQGGPQINMMTADKNVIYLFMIDKTIDETIANLFKQYAEAFFLGCPVKLVRPGEQVFSEKVGNKTKTMSLPLDFVAKHNIASRTNLGD